MYAIPMRSPWAAAVAAPPIAAPKIALRGAVRPPPEVINPRVPPISAPAAASDCSFKALYRYFLTLGQKSASGVFLLRST